MRISSNLSEQITMEKLGRNCWNNNFYRLTEELSLNVLGDPNGARLTLLLYLALRVIICLKFKKKGI